MEVGGEAKFHLQCLSKLVYAAVRILPYPEKYGSPAAPTLNCPVEVF